MKDIKLILARMDACGVVNHYTLNLELEKAVRKHVVELEDIVIDLRVGSHEYQDSYHGDEIVVSDRDIRRLEEL